MSKAKPGGKKEEKVTAEATGAARARAQEHTEPSGGFSPIPRRPERLKRHPAPVNANYYAKTHWRDVSIVVFPFKTAEVCVSMHAKRCSNTFDLHA